MNRKLTRRQVLTAAAAGAALTLCGCRQQEPEEAKPELILRREDPRAGTVNVHFPRIGYVLKKATP